MNEEKLKQILDKIGQTGVPPEIALIAEQSSRNFLAALKYPKYKRWFLTPARILAAAAAILLAFALGRWSKPIPSPSSNITAYASPASIYSSVPKSGNGFWQQKMVAAMQPRPYARTSFDKAGLLNSYKQYLKEKYND